MTRSFPGEELEGRGEGEEKDCTFQDKAESFKTYEGQDRNRENLLWPEVGLEGCWQDKEESHEELWTFQFSSVTQSCPTLCDPMNRSTPGLPVHHKLPEFTQTHAHRVSDAIQPSHPLSSPSPPALNPSQHQGLFQ